LVKKNVDSHLGLICGVDKLHSSFFLLCHWQVIMSMISTSSSSSRCTILRTIYISAHTRNEVSARNHYMRRRNVAAIEIIAGACHVIIASLTSPVAAAIRWRRYDNILQIFDTAAAVINSCLEIPAHVIRHRNRSSVALLTAKSMERGESIALQNRNPWADCQKWSQLITHAIHVSQLLLFSRRKPKPNVVQITSAQIREPSVRLWL